MLKINEEELNKVRDELKHENLNLAMIGRIFGQKFWELLVICMIDSKVAYDQLLKMIEQNQKPNA